MIESSSELLLCCILDISYTYRLVHVSLSQLKQMAGTFEIVSIEKDDFATELTKIRSKFKQVAIYVNHANNHAEIFLQNFA